jgi:hypothetical protein
MDEAPEPDRFEDLFQVNHRVITPEIIERRRRARRFVLWTMISMLAILSLAAVIYAWRHAAAARSRAAIESVGANPELYAAAQGAPAPAAPRSEPSVLTVAPAEPVVANPPPVEVSAEPAVPVHAEARPQAQVRAGPRRVSQPGRPMAEVAAPTHDVPETTPAAKFEATK